MKMNKREMLFSFTGLAHIYRGAPPPPPKKKRETKKGKTERVLKQKLLKAITKVQGQNVIVSAILARVSIIQKFFLLANNGGQQYFSVFHMAPPL